MIIKHIKINETSKLKKQRKKVKSVNDKESKAVSSWIKKYGSHHIKNNFNHYDYAKEKANLTFKCKYIISDNIFEYIYTYNDKPSKQIIELQKRYKRYKDYLTYVSLQLNNKSVQALHLLFEYKYDVFLLADKPF